MNDFAVIVLAAGKGTRMKSELPKVLHKIGTQPMLKKTIDIIKKTKPKQTIVVVGFGAQEVKKAIGKGVEYALQKEQLGTAHAADSALSKVKKEIKTVVILNGDDSAFYKPQTIKNIIASHHKLKKPLTFVTLVPNDPTGLGRIVRKGGKVIKVVEEKDASEKEKEIKEVNDGLYVFDKAWLEKNLPKIDKSKATGEYYLVDLIKIAIENNFGVNAYTLKDASQWHGINTPQDLQFANTKAKSIHIMGISGAGAAAVAGIAIGYGYKVTGCDINPHSPYSKSLGLEVMPGHSQNHLKDTDMLIYSPAVEKLDPKNEEIAAAKAKKIPTLTWQEFQGRYLQLGKFVITVAGAYGKSTTTSMVAKILEDANFDPTCEIGAKVLNWQSNFRVGKSNYYVCEADEYNDNFLNYHPDISVILNVAWDHPDFFKSEKQLLASYQKFINNIKNNGYLIIPNNPKLKALAKKARADVQVVEVKDFGNYRLKIIGDFRKLNADAALTSAQILGIDQKLAKDSVENFKGTGRRMEFKGEIEGVKFFDDYAVQPYTILKTADALKEKFKKEKVILVLEPHTFTRINTFFSDFVSSLKKTKVDHILITDVYAARERGDAKGLSQKLADTAGEKARFCGSIEETALYIRRNIKDFGVVCSMGAGNSYKLYNLVSK